jgi:hypothetical protein
MKPKTITIVRVAVKSPIHKELFNEKINITCFSEFEK